MFRFFQNRETAQAISAGAQATQPNTGSSSKRPPRESVKSVLSRGSLRKRLTRRPWEWLITFLSTLLFHLALLFIAALIVFEHEEFHGVLQAILIPNDPGDADAKNPEKLIVDSKPGQEQDDKELPERLLDLKPIDDVANPIDVNDLPPSIQSETIDDGSASDANLAAAVDSRLSSELAGRRSATRMQLVKARGGTAESEAAVAAGLKWLARHQEREGSWSFHHDHPAGCDCTQIGHLDRCRNAATGLALLAFLGAGHTPLEGEYQAEVKRGIAFLRKSFVKTEEGLDFRGQVFGNEGMYTHAIATIALCETFAMTRDKELRETCEGAIDFIVNSQDKKGGGWRYFPKMPGDTSVVAWQVMAIKSAQASRILVPKPCTEGAKKFMRSVSSNNAANYSYMPGRNRSGEKTMTAAGLLCRIYLDGQTAKGAIKNGSAYLAKQGPDPGNIYYNYYATQVMHHWGGEDWNRWNAVMREMLIDSQIKTGHAAGSWDVRDDHGNAGGRLYMTALAVMTLEVYYRYLPLYEKDKLDLQP
jgi:hypothetical protein